VGAGTFKPVKASSMELHVMHEEHIIVEKQTIQNLLTCIQQKNRIIAVGTTSVRTIESLYWFGIDLLNKKNHWATIEHIKVNQWQPYEIQEFEFHTEQILQTILEWMEVKKLNVLSGFTQIMIAPPYQLKLVDALITNFHQPESTLLLLIASVIGPNWKNVYEYALNNHFRFLSYGDSSILFKS
jgi:S-adenosylmethionine:tRNA ribosyltransferase-isomerase